MKKHRLVLSRDQLRRGFRKMLLVARVEDGLKVGNLRRRHIHKSKLQKREARALAEGMEMVGIN